MRPIRHPAVDHCRAVYATARHFLKFPWTALSFSQIAQLDQNYLFVPSARFGRNLAFSPNAQLDQNSGHVRSAQIGVKAYLFRIAQSDQNSGYVRNAHLVSRAYPSQLRKAIKTDYLPEMRTWAKPPHRCDRKRLITMKGQEVSSEEKGPLLWGNSFPEPTREGASIASKNH